MMIFDSAAMQNLIVVGACLSELDYDDQAD